MQMDQCSCALVFNLHVGNREKTANQLDGKITLTTFLSGAQEAPPLHENHLERFILQPDRAVVRPCKCEQWESEINTTLDVDQMLQTTSTQQK